MRMSSYSVTVAPAPIVVIGKLCTKICEIWFTDTGIFDILSNIADMEEATFCEEVVERLG